MIDLSSLDTLWMRLRPWRISDAQHAELVAAVEARLVSPTLQAAVADMPNKARFYWLDAERRQDDRQAAAWLPLAAKECDLAVAALVTRLVAAAGKAPERKKTLLYRAFQVGDMGALVNSMRREVETYRKIAEIIGEKLVEAKAHLQQRQRPDVDVRSPDPDEDDVPIDLPQPHYGVTVLTTPLLITGDRETVERLKGFRDLERPIARAPINPGWREKMPNARWFDPLRKLIERRLAGFRTTPFRMAPLLIVGAPGIGKSRFVADLAAALEVPVLPISFAGQSDARALLGTARGWSSANPSSLIDLGCKLIKRIAVSSE